MTVIILRLETSISIDALISMAQIAVEFDRADAGSDKDCGTLSEKLSKNSKNCQKSNNLKYMKDPKNHCFDGMFTNIPIFHQLYIKN